MVIFTRYPSKLSGYQMSVVHLTNWNKTVVIQLKKDAVMKKFDPTQLSCFTGTEDWFVQVRMTVNGNKVTMIYEDGSGSEHARQEIPYIDFPMHAISLYACWDGEHWVIMLPSEYWPD